MMLLVGLVILGVIRLHFALGVKLSSKMQALGEARGGFLGAYALSVALSLAFCPTLFFLFFGLTLPLAATSPFGSLYPAVFALGMSVPLLGLASLWSLSREDGEASRCKRYLRGWRSWNRAGTYLAGIVMLSAGLQETFVYWLL
ncbi:hypothetical protein [Deinococcus peraridilitoris]|uniref:Urease accessory protein UreH-like transmembrane domain-containing protein n=1 Tax=Deinococcus peraridilitoris (strain DSM 19664 / LMG 22246 / CIP 109416 / KR-200) TaxID=937777 RepID=L0A7X8_DEIPD|nr:hypothetical protein [Deinococcus peraridilitoris]AFZ69287.1 hypothetical protein Deipe_3872 [Deinococcus peraridilitoris DSM 19664]